MESKVNIFKEAMKDAMIDNFKTCGYLVPVVFFYTGEKPIIVQLPPDFMGDRTNKIALTETIRDYCIKNNCLAAGLITEAYGAKVDSNSETAKKLTSGEMRTSECDEKQDIIIMLFSTPERDELISYVVDLDKKSVGVEFSTPDMQSTMMGILGDFFKWNKN